MAQVRSVYLTPPGPFEFRDDNRVTAGSRWPIWLTEFNTFITASGVANDAQIKALLLYTAGKEVRDIYLANGTGQETPDETRLLLTNYFAPLVNPDYETFAFSRMCQKQNETVDDFAVRLRRAATRCGFQAAAIPGEVKKQIIAGCQSSNLRKHILETPNITLDQILIKARALQISSVFTKPIEEQVNIKQEPISSVQT